MLIAAFQMVADISIHAPREGGDENQSCCTGVPENFNPRPPRGGRLFRLYLKLEVKAISIHAPREGGDNAVNSVINFFKISIHAPREGGDGGARHRHRCRVGISIHAPREGGDVRSEFLNTLKRLVFQSTPPARGATKPKRNAMPIFARFQSTPPARGAT